MNAEALNEMNHAREVQPKVEMTGAEILLQCLLREGVETVFGYPGGAVLPIYDSLYGHQLKHMLFRHEQGAVHAADGYARATGRPGVVLATSGPGATNLVTGIATAQMDSVPLVCITGNVKQTLIGSDAFQEADIIGITMPVVKHSYFVRDIHDLPRIIQEAFHIAATGRPGPVLIDIPKDVNEARAVVEYPETINIRGYNPTTKPNSLQVTRMVQAIQKSRKPVILAGGGVVTSGAHEALIQFAERSRIPVTTTFMGISGFPGHHPLFLGMPGMHGTYAANHALLECDLLIGIGNRFDDRITMGRIDKFATNAKIIHIDIDPAEIGKNVETFIPVVGDAKTVLDEVNQRVEPVQTGEWLTTIAGWKAEYPLKYKQTDEGLKPQAVIQLLHESTNGDAIVSTDVGQHQMWVAQYFQFKHHRSLLSSGGLGTMGFGFPAAIGAQVAYPDKTVIAVVGDGGFQMTAQELAIIAIHNLPVKVALINNRCLGMVRQWQEVFYDTRYSEVNLAGPPDFVKLAEAYGVKGLRATSLAEAKEKWHEALSHPGPAVVEFQVDEDENVYPMVAPGCGLDEMEMGEE